MTLKHEYVAVHDPKVQAALTELRSIISSRFPTAGFEEFQGLGDDEHGTYLEATVDVDDPDVVTDMVIDRLLDLEIDQGLPIYVLAVRTPERVTRELASRPRPAYHTTDPAIDPKPGADWGRAEDWSDWQGAPSPPTQ